jgi:hypothetical protein
MNNSKINWSEIKLLRSELFSEDEIQLMEKIFEKANSSDHFENWRNMINPIEEKIGGTGIKDLLVETEHGGYTGNYDIKDRSIYRPLQYATVCFTHKDINGFLRRDSIQESCEHIENVLKRYFSSTLNISNIPLGQIIGKIKQKKLLDNNMILLLEKINVINRIAKHDYNEDSIPIDYDPYEDHMFTLMEAISMYFICRKVGFILMKKI